MASEEQIRRNIEYNRDKTTIKSVRFTNRKDKDILEHLDTLNDSFSGYVKKLIRADMAKTRRNKTG
jgi:hypothetical protein